MKFFLVLFSIFSPLLMSSETETKKPVELESSPMVISLGWEAIKDNEELLKFVLPYSNLVPTLLKYSSFLNKEHIRYLTQLTNCSAMSLQDRMAQCQDFSTMLNEDRVKIQSKLKEIPTVKTLLEGSMKPSLYRDPRREELLLDAIFDGITCTFKSTMPPAQNANLASPFFIHADIPVTEILSKAPIGVIEKLLRDFNMAEEILIRSHLAQQIKEKLANQWMDFNQANMKNSAVTMAQQLLQKINTEITEELPLFWAALSHEPVVKEIIDALLKHPSLAKLAEPQEKKKGSKKKKNWTSSDSSNDSSSEDSESDEESDEDSDEESSDSDSQKEVITFVRPRSETYRNFLTGSKTWDNEPDLKGRVIQSIMYPIMGISRYTTCHLTRHNSIISINTSGRLQFTGPKN